MQINTEMFSMFRKIWDCLLLVISHGTNNDVDRITAKDNKVLGLLKRACRDLNDVDSMRTLYCSLVRPLLEYSCETWNPYTKRNSDKLEAVQRRATRWITRSDDDFDTRLSKFKLLSLFDSRFIRDVTFLFNVINDHYDIDLSNKLIFCKDRSISCNLRKNDTQDLVLNFSRTNGLKYSFFNRIVGERNILPNQIKESNSIETFKKNVLSFIKDN